jgi:hypothetical protein
MVLLEIGLQTCMTHTIAECTVNKLLMMGRGTARNMQSFMPKKIWGISASCWFYYKEKSHSLVFQLIDSDTSATRGCK